MLNSLSIYTLMAHENFDALELNKVKEQWKYHKRDSLLVLGMFSNIAVIIVALSTEILFYPSLNKVCKPVFNTGEVQCVIKLLYEIVSGDIVYNTHNPQSLVSKQIPTVNADQN